MRAAMKTIEERFWSKVNKQGGIPSHRPELGNCWEWTAGRFDVGYGAFANGGQNEGAHRFSFRLKNGKIKKGMYVLHKCDNMICVRPSHLFQGTDKDNADDREAKGHTNKPKGELHPMAKLTEKQVLKIRALSKK